MDNIYLENGYADREEYLEALALDYDIDIEIILALADTLGPSEDFDGLISALEDAEAMRDN